jgi:hypothetical protein
LYRQTSIGIINCIAIPSVIASSYRPFHVVTRRHTSSHDHPPARLERRASGARDTIPPQRGPSRRQDDARAAVHRIVRARGDARGDREVRTRGGGGGGTMTAASVVPAPAEASGADAGPPGAAMTAVGGGGGVSRLGSELRRLLREG